MARFLLLSSLLVAIACTTLAWGLTIDDLGLTAENCASIRSNPSSSGIGYIPCGCRLNTGNVEVSRCYPNCCAKTDVFEGDRCHIENKLDWTVYEQQVCREQPPVEYLADNPNCFYRGNPPLIHSVAFTPLGSAPTATVLTFELSILDQHKCDNLFISKCKNQRNSYPQNDFRVNTTDPVPKHCWLSCPPTPLAQCTAASCTYHRGETRSVIRSWSIAEKLLPGDYTMTCYTLVKGQSVGSTLFQNAYATSSFKVDG